MKKSNLLFIGLSILFGVISYISSNNIFVGITVLLISLVDFFLIVSPLYKRGTKKRNRLHDCYQFINSFLVSLSIKHTINPSYEATLDSMSIEFRDYLQGVEELNVEEKLEYLRKYFKFDIYFLFLNVLAIYSQEGGDILKMSANLIEETRLVEEYVIQSDSLAKRKYYEVSLLWSICLTILVVLRFALSDFYIYIQSQLTFIISVVALFIFVLFSINMLVIKANSLDLKGWTNDEK